MVDYSKWDRFDDPDEEKPKKFPPEPDPDPELERIRKQRLKGCAEVHLSRMEKLQGKLAENGIFDLLMDLFLPDQFVELRWNMDDVALFGNTVPAARLNRKPKMVFETEENAKYTVVLFTCSDYVGPRAEPGTAITPQFLRWVRVNMKDCNDRGDDVVDYLPPTPDDGVQRVVGVLLQQPASMKWEDSERIGKDSVEPRREFEINSFVRKFMLKPIAANLVRSAP
eukprot:TRINITY_DN2620_c0_g1_i1.p1 TRINITY_DN2620_c0_g1~~TRINITY_DN2620_c0_g1_i1.p1  ORF type:complete len:235 (+),score=50.57 TRINITY_DN2620_c0_g1_i1:31-705(+)